MRARSNKNRYKKVKVEKVRSDLTEYVEIIDKRDFAKVSILSTGELINGDVPEKLLALSEMKELLAS
jgi:hypothetical protein